MIVLCANCIEENRPAFLREIPPYRDQGVSHGLCEEHAEMYLAEIANRKGDEGKAPEAPDDEASLTAWRPLPLAFEVWLTISRDNEILALLDLIKRALEGRGYTVECSVTQQTPPPSAPGAAPERES